MLKNGRNISINHQRPREQAERFIHILDDLSYAKTFYPQSKATKWINGIAASTYQKFIRTRRKIQPPLAILENRIAVNHVQIQ